MSSTDQLTDSVTYHSAWYRRYRHLEGVDNVKKRLERDALIHALASRFQRPGRMLDIGTATGRYPILFARAGWHSVGLDISPVAVAMAREELARSDVTAQVNFLCGDIRTVALPEGYFDLVTCMMGTFAHVPKADRVDPTLTAIHRALAPGGHVAISNWNVAWPDGRMLSIYEAADREWLTQATPTLEEMSEMLTAVGFEQVTALHICPFTDTQIERWISARMDSAERIQAYMLANEITIPGQMYLVMGTKA